MFRLIGFLIGSLTSIVIILLIIGMPNFHFAEEQDDQQRFDDAIEKLKAKQREFESVTGKLSEDVARVADSVEQEFESNSDTGSAAAEMTAPFESDVEPEVSDELPQAAKTETIETFWFSFWNPFRSEIAANGFVSRLEQVTGIDYRVVKVKTGVYEVAFPYQDDEERRSKISRIASATGLDLPDS
jgi:hypothetical protein